MSESKKDITKTEATKNETKKASDKNGNGVFQRIGKFFREFRSEIKKISWPTFAEVVKNTIITLVVVAIFAIVIGLFDWGVSSLRDWAITSVQENEIVNDVDVSDTDAVLVTPSDVTLSGGDVTAE